jgi:dTDP-4-amino-4,6-dideoxygalactose transaminase
VGAKLRLVDVAKGRFLLDIEKIAYLINENTKAIIPVDIAGTMPDYDAIRKVVEAKKGLFKPVNKMQEALGRVLILADSAHGLGSMRKMETGMLMSGVCADFTAFSFHAVKNFTTAEGGAIMWKSIDGVADEDIYKQFQLFSLHGQSKDALAKTQLCAWEYDIKGTYYKCNMTDIMAAIGLVQLKRYPDLLARRKEIIAIYEKGLKADDIEILPHVTDEYVSDGHLMIVRLLGKDEEARNELIRKMAEKHIATNVHYKPLPMHTAYKNLGFKIEDFGEAYNMYHNEITLPLHTKLTDEEVEYIIENFNKLR